MSDKYTVEQAKRVLQNEKTFNLNNNKIPDLRIIKDNYFGLKRSPDDIPNDSPEGVVFYTLNTCYKRENNISEGKLVDVLDGFHHGGIPTQVTWDGLKKLKALGYLKFTDAAGIPLLGGAANHMWYQWTPKFLELLFESKNTDAVEVVRNDYDKAKWDDVK